MLNVLVGAHGTGKSTLLQELKGKVPYYVTDGFSRPIKESFKAEGYDDFQFRDFQQGVLNHISLWGWENYLDQNVISARSLVDVIVYSRFFFPAWDYTNYIGNFRKNKEKVNFFYLPIEFDLKGDGIRFENREEQREIDGLLKLFLIEESVTFISLTGTVDQRLQTLKTHLK